MKKILIAVILFGLCASECYAVGCSGGSCRKPLRLRIFRR